MRRLDAEALKPKQRSNAAVVYCSNDGLQQWPTTASSTAASSNQLAMRICTLSGILMNTSLINSFSALNDL